MIIIFGGTTEGRLAVDVCEQAGSPFYYSTKSSLQDIEMHNGVRLFGAMSQDDIIAFCREHDVRCIVDAAHPFAEGLHTAIANSGLPVIRFQRSFAEHRKDVTYCSDYDDAIGKLRSCHVKRLLALSGVNTIKKLKPYWSEHETLFRILNRQESINIARLNGFPEENIIFYNDDNTLPSVDDEIAMMRSVCCDAIITKESGDTGGFSTKVDAAISLGIKVFVVERPELPRHWTYVMGQHGLRRAIQHLAPEFFPLKTGLTTGACATAATKAAALSLLFDEYPEDISFALPDGEILTIPVHHEAKGIASVIKESNDDPDVTKGCRITSEVCIPKNEFRKGLTLGERGEMLHFLSGTGVGIVTLPGLGIPVGEPAINPTPRRMIAEELAQLTSQPLDITISVENGEELAKRTFNHKVGVVGGISIIGTSGIVHPLSNEAFISSIHRELEVAWAIGEREIGLVAGMKSEKALLASQHPSPHTHHIRCVHYGNFIGESLKAAHDIGFRKATVAIMIGKAVKLAEGHLDTHSHKVAMNKDFLHQIAVSLNIDASPIEHITMARELLHVMPQPFFDRIAYLCKTHCQSVFPDGDITINLVQ